jgi:hypothetical protein
MAEHEAARTLVKSPPELWEVCSDPESLGRHLRPFGEIRITRLEPETTVAWEGERASGTVRIEPGGWGTKVTLTALAAAEPVPEPPEPPPPPPPPAVVIVAPTQPRSGLFGRLLERFGFGPAAVPPSRPVAPAARKPPAQAPPDEPSIDAPRVLDAALDSLGQAHHRPFSRG